MRNTVSASVLSLLLTFSSSFAGPNDLELQTSVCFGDNPSISNLMDASEYWQELSSQLSRLFGRQANTTPEVGYQMVYNFSASHYDLNDYGVSIKLKAADIDGYNYRVKSTIKVADVNSALYDRLNQFQTTFLSTSIVSEYNLDQVVLDQLFNIGTRRLPSSPLLVSNPLLNYEFSIENSRSRAAGSIFSKEKIHQLFQYGKGRSLQKCSSEESCVLSQPQRDILNTLALLRNIPMSSMSMSNQKIANALSGSQSLIQVGQLEYKKQVWRIGPHETDWVDANYYNHALKENFMADQEFEIHLEQWTNKHDFENAKSIFEISLKAKNFKQNQNIQKLGEYFFSSIDSVEISRCKNRIRNRDFAVGKMMMQPLAQK